VVPRQTRNDRGPFVDAVKKAGDRPEGRGDSGVLMLSINTTCWRAGHRVAFCGRDRTHASSVGRDLIADHFGKIR